MSIDRFFNIMFENYIHGNVNDCWLSKPILTTILSYPCPVRQGLKSGFIFSCSRRSSPYQWNTRAPFDWSAHRHRGHLALDRMQPLTRARTTALIDDEVADRRGRGVDIGSLDNPRGYYSRCNARGRAALPRRYASRICRRIYCR